MTKTKIFGVPITQRTEISKHCFGDCGAIKVGGWVVGDCAYLPCTKPICPAELQRREMPDAH